ncbi:Xaa-Pro dipeptidyl-peptidase [Ligilactobacillus hayakitensis DSM 18933 = JCM 14209]|uniref:Xaa-Pro dipeptidyl-peptidase n=1 Tax=Ligilactobacillus hayakitensis DSM 18933 = JCM 14209 TaxID=1423755 RepID=A0A0R1WPH7_9LACO|nr:Xaa-Pro dipeptidyl-peptidase [Ligilactobacillus hayakitensis]KRM19646.1 Xaa-Pro dipeptidyl-peptidase [Ligilactobacillus hayakitensis DSM 18933 = JCM 14209]
MKFNQFAFVDVPYEQKVTELKRISFLHMSDESLFINNLYELFLRRALCDAISHDAQTNKLKGLLASKNANAYTYIHSSKINAKTFYVIGLQLLGFEVDLDFTVDDPFKAMDEYQLPYIHSIQTVEDLISAWYDLLCTPSKNGRTLLDHLANKGYFTDFYGNVNEPVFFNGKAQPVFDTRKLITEVIYVESDLDTDNDGQRDVLKVIITRPSETNHGLKVPTLFTASPYYLGTNDETAAKMMHEVKVPLTHKEPNELTYQDIEYHQPKTPLPPKRTYTVETKKAEETAEHLFTVTLNDYMLARGFAVAYSGGVGSLGSDGFKTTGDYAETISAKNVVEWLTNQRPGFTTKDGNKAINAWWSNNKVAMTGKSYLGTLATATATTGVEGLETIISEAAISNWYDYYREGGLVIAPGGFPGEDCDILAAECFSRQKEAGDYLNVKDEFAAYLKQMAKDQDRTSGNYNTFFDARNYLKDVENIKCDIVMVHGLNDWNVKIKNVFNLFNRLKDTDVTKKLFLHQGQHIYMNNFQSIDFTDMMNLWLSHKLYDVDNHAKEQIPDIVVQDNASESTWHTYKDWQVDELTPAYLSDGAITNEPENIALKFKDDLPQEDFLAYTANVATWKQDLLKNDINNKLHSNRLVFKSKPLTKDQLLKGQAKLHLRLKSGLDHGLISVKLVDYGLDKRLGEVPTILERRGLDHGFHFKEDDLVEFKLQTNTEFKMITQSHLNLQNRTNDYKNDDLKADTFYDITLVTQPMFYHLKAGHQLGLVVYASDYEMTVHANEENTYTLDLSQSKIELPLTAFND